MEQGAVQCGHTASYYYVGKSPVTAFGTALPFGLTNRQNNAWFYQGGGLEMMQAFYGERFGVIQFPAGNTGAQMGGWFNKEIQSIADMEGLKMRIPGLGGQVMDRLGVTVQVLPGGEIFQALQTGAIDAAEWVGPYDDLRLNFQQAAQFYYYPGWWEPGPTLEVQVNLDEWNGLPEEYQAAIATAASVANTNMMATYDAKNIPALAELMSSECGAESLPGRCHAGGRRRSVRDVRRNRGFRSGLQLHPECLERVPFRDPGLARLGRSRHDQLPVNPVVQQGAEHRRFVRRHVPAPPIANSSQPGGFRVGLTVCSDRLVTEKAALFQSC